MPPVPVTDCPCEFEVSRITHLVTGSLPPGGQFTSQAYYTIPSGIRNITFYVTYSYGVPGGYPVVRLIWGDGFTEAQETLLESNVVDTSPAPFAPQNLFLQEMNGPVPPTTAPITFLVEASVPGGAKTVRLIIAEKGVPSAPGIAGITLTASP